MDWKTKLSKPPRLFRGLYLGHVAKTLGIQVDRLAEIGVGAGDNAAALRQAFPQATIHLVDPYQVTDWYRPANATVGFFTDIGSTQADYDRAYKSVKERFAKDKAMQLIRQASPQAAEKFEDGSLDLVFIDDDHSRSGCGASIQAWRPKVRRGGILAGHDVGTDGVDWALKFVLGEDNWIPGADATWVHIVPEAQTPPIQPDAE